VLLITGTSFADRDGVRSWWQILKQYSRPAGKELMSKALPAISFTDAAKYSVAIVARHHLRFHLLLH